MLFAKIKSKSQLTLPAAIIKKTGLRWGDLLEVSMEGNRITLTPKDVVDRTPTDIADTVSELKDTVAR